ncbi:MAG: hypothetical protein IAE77_19400 [Prosthecobacter sp.]|jgi:antitoxin (DNA-binding transcriptional repressor) of toxin-antitoxin stability system|nr:hypothetical protein [Prosthecobacter sp.]
MSVSDALRQFASLIHRVRHDGERALLTEGGAPVARMIPAVPAIRGAELARVWRDGPHLGDEAVSFEADVLEARSKLPAVPSRWE